MEKIKSFVCDKTSWLRIGQRVTDAFKFMCVAFFIGIFVYVAIVSIGCGLLPVLLSSLAGAVGVTASMSLLDVAVLWLFPSLFVTGFLFVSTIMIIKKFVKWFYHLFYK